MRMAFTKTSMTFTPLVVLFAGAWLLMVGNWFLHTPGIGAGDAASYVCSAENIAKNGFFPGNWYASGFGYSLLIQVVHGLGVDWSLAARLLSLAAGFVNIFLIGSVLARIFNDERARVLVLPLFLLPDYISSAVLGYPGTIFTFFLFASTYLFIENSAKKFSPKAGGLFTIIFSFTLWIRISLAAFIPYFIWKNKFSKNQKIFFLAGIIFAVIVYALLLSNNVRDDTSLQYLPFTEYFSHVWSNSVIYFYFFAILFPFIIPFVIWIPHALSKEVVRETLWWSAPYAILLLLFPLGQNVYYLFPILPFFLVSGFLTMEWLTKKMRLSRNVIIGLVLLQFLWLVPGFLAFEETSIQYQDIAKGFDFMSRADHDPLIITGREGEAMGPRFHNYGACHENGKPDVILHPYTVKRLFNGKSMEKERMDASAMIARAREEGREIWITSEAISFEQNGWCRLLECIPLPGYEKEPIFRTENYSIFRAK